MVILETSWGNFFLDNAVKIDFYRVKEDKFHSVYFSVDNYKNRIYSFEDVLDAQCLVNYLKNVLKENLFSDAANSIIELDYEVSLALSEMLNTIRSDHQAKSEQVKEIEIINDELEGLARLWKATDEIARFYKIKESAIKEHIIRIAENQECCGYGLRLKKVNVSKQMDYNRFVLDLKEKFPEVYESIPIDNYLINSSIEWQIHQQNEN